MTVWPRERSPARPAHTLHRWAAAATVCLGFFLLGMDLTILNVAVPDLHDDLHPTMAEVQWIVDAYPLVLGGTVLATGSVTDRIGRRRAFTAGLALCAAASVFGALGRNPAQVITARGAMGAGAALLMPATLSIIHHLFPEPALRRRAIALWTAMGGMGGLTGPLIGGWLVEHFSWRAGFWINLPFATTTLVLALLIVPASRSPVSEPLDLPGTLLSGAGLLALVGAVIDSPARGWTSPRILAAYAAAGLLLAAFAARQARARHPMLPPALLGRSRIGVGAAALALMSFGLFGALFVTTLYLQGVWGYSPWQAGLRTLPLPVGLAAGAALTLPMATRWGDELPLVTGLITVTAGFAILATTTATSGYGHLLLFQAVAGTGAGLTAAAATETVMSAVPAHRAGLGSAINDATRQVGSTLGVAVQGSVLTTVYSNHLHERLGAAHADGPLDTAADSILSARALSARLPADAGHRLLSAATESFVTGLTHTALTAGGVTLGAALAAACRLPAPRRHGTTEKPAGET
ncbi:MFS transporter [Streptomyces sp. SCA3-4]|uniref:MFS transporter n=1 Tax=Streptomyces sichuanensis TaxID=2871810 RepID=UPI001CE26AC7|nr:MFS transporter [Streptomyces sichuanensis]MCA6091905.1 MFS transporter [Streptomyces sichuanensis]